MLRAVAAAGLSLGGPEGSGAGGGGAKPAVASKGGGDGGDPSPGPPGLQSHGVPPAVSPWLGRATVTQRREDVTGPNVDSEALPAGRSGQVRAGQVCSETQPETSQETASVGLGQCHNFKKRK